MPHLRREEAFDSTEVLEGLLAFCKEAAEKYGTSVAVRPPHRRPFHWPPHSVSHRYHVIKSDWTGKTVLEENGESFEVIVAKTP
ncbi:MAG TPA: hypothetical protein VK171_02010, partial [Fimbriimonas sp.]|nr:hypothetical protein [Fimbriimonas sp.]